MKQIITLTTLFILSVNVVNAQNNMSNKELESIVNISTFASRGELAKLKPALVAGLEAGLTVNEIKEVLVHLYAYCGFPRSLRALQTFMEVLGERKNEGVSEDWGKEASPITDTRPKYERGTEILATLQGVPAPENRPTNGYAGFSPEIETFLKEHLFADIFERDVLTYAQREIVTVSVLISIGGVEPMLKSHINLALNTGVTPQQIEDIIQIIEYNIDTKDAETNQLILEEVLKTRSN